MAFFGKVFGKESSGPRSLTSATDLEPGDFVKFGFNALADLSNQSLSVDSVSTQDLGGEDKKKVLFELQGSSVRLRLAQVRGGQGDKLEIGRQIYPEDVEQCFKIKAFIDLLDTDTGVNHVLKRKGKPDSLSGWLGKTYRQEAGHNAYLYDADYRHKPMPDDASTGRDHSYYYLVTDDRDYALEVQVFDGGQTDVWLLVYLDLDVLEEMWPAAQEIH